MGLLPLLHEKGDTVWVYWIGPLVGAIIAVLVFWLTNADETLPSFDDYLGNDAKNKKFRMQETGGDIHLANAAGVQSVNSKLKDLRQIPPM